MTSATAIKLRPVHAALAVVVIAVLLMVLWPSRPAGGGQNALEAWFVRAHAAGLPGWISFGLTEFAANVVMFVPLGLFGALAGPRGGTRTVLIAAAALSVAVELTQWLVLPHRTGDPRDVAANILGAALGVALARLLSGQRR